MIAIPTAQRFIAGVFKKKLQRRRFDVAVAKYHVGFALMTVKISMFIHSVQITIKSYAAIKALAKCHHIAWTNHF